MRPQSVIFPSPDGDDRMNNAQAIYESLDRYVQIQNLLGKQEDIFLDFKERERGWNSLDKMADNERRLFSKAASGFAHQEGGVLVWGIEARKDSNGVDQAYALKPFQKVKQFKQTLEDYTNQTHFLRKRRLSRLISGMRLCERFL
jgi:hypothetical protein